MQNAQTPEQDSQVFACLPKPAPCTGSSGSSDDELQMLEQAAEELAAMEQQAAAMAEAFGVPPLVLGQYGL